MGAIDDFRTFITKGNVLDLAVAFIIGAAFTAVVTALVADIITPIIGIAGHVDFSSWRLTINGSAILFGLFLNSLISFIIIALVVFFALVRPIAKMEERRKAKLPAAAVTTKDCPFCFSSISIKATRCPNCTSTLS